jgi:AAA family ATP:ADP antiporter
VNNVVARLKAAWRRSFDVRPGEGLRTLFMALYLLFALFAYYIIKPVSRALFLNNFDIDRLPWLYILIASAGGVLAFLYTKIAVRASLQLAVNWATGFFVGSLVLIWWLLRFELPWMYYVFNVWVSLFSIVLVSQGWLVAGNVFSSREAKRLYGMLGVGAVVGAAFGGTFTAFTVELVGTTNLLLASAVMVLLGYGCFRLVVLQRGVSLAGVKAAEDEEADFHFRDLVGAIGRYRHLQVIIGIISLTYMVDVMVEYQFSAMAKLRFTGDELTAFLASFYGIYLNLLTFVLQFFLTAAVVARFGVSGTLQMMPVTIGTASLGIFLLPSIVSTSIARLAEAAGRYSFNRTGMELLYLPLPTDLRNRTKAFVDVFVDRLSRGIGGMLLVLTTGVLALEVRSVSLVVLTLTALWSLLLVRARKEYIQTVRQRLDARRLDLESARITVKDPATVELLESAARGGRPRQAWYALSTLAEVPGYDLRPLLAELVDHDDGEVRAKVYELGRRLRYDGLVARARSESERTVGSASALREAIAYLLTTSEQPKLAAENLLHHAHEAVVEAALEAIAKLPGIEGDLISHEWIQAAAADPAPARRRLAAEALRVRGDQGSEALHRLLEDGDRRVVLAACKAAGALRNRAYLSVLIRYLGNAAVRGSAIEALANYAGRILGTLGDVLDDESVAVAVRRQVPRVLRLIPEQRSVDILLQALSQRDISIRAAALKALNRVREVAPTLDFGDPFVTEQIYAEARSYFELAADLQLWRQRPQRSAAGLLARSIEEKLHQSLERLFRLLGLRYPPREIYATYLMVSHGRAEQVTAALEFLDSVLDRDLKRVLLPLLDDAARLVERGRDLFGIQPRSPEAALRGLIRCGEPWLAACAIATAAELQLTGLRSDIVEVRQQCGPEVAQVAWSAAAALA